MNLGMRLEHRDRLCAGWVHGVMAVFVTALLLGLSGRHVTIAPALFLAMTPAWRMPLGSMQMVVSIMIVTIMIAVMSKNGDAVMITITVLRMMIIAVFIVIVVVPACKSWSSNQASSETCNRQVA